MIHKIPEKIIEINVLIRELMDNHILTYFKRAKISFKGDTYSGGRPASGFHKDALQEKIP